MAAKPVKVKKNPKDQGIIGSIESEVSTEASPMLMFIVNNAKAIVGLVVVLGVLIAGFGVYGWKEEGALKEAREELARVSSLGTPEERVAGLEKYLETASEKVRPAVYLSLIEAASETANHEKLVSYWEALAETGGPEIRVTAAMGRSRALVEQGKAVEALGVLEAQLGETTSGRGLILLNAEVVAVAEELGNLQRAADACAAIVSNSQSQQEQALWRQRGADFRLKIAELK